MPILSKNFHLFGGSECYYASGGANDYIKSFDNLIEAETYAKNLESSDYTSSELDWWHITDSNFKIVKDSEFRPYCYNAGAASKEWS